MAIVESTSQRLVLQSGSTTLTLDREARKLSLQRKILLWQKKPLETALSEVTDVSVDTAVDRASGVEICHTMVVFRDGQGWALGAADKTEAQAHAAAIREFIGLPT
jgi:hypothetical protein